MPNTNKKYYIIHIKVPSLIESARSAGHKHCKANLILIALPIVQANSTVKCKARSFAIAPIRDQY